jgi:hypothetical protein
MKEVRGSVSVFTCAAVNYLPKVRVLCNTLKQQHPELEIYLALADEKPDGFDLDNEPFDVVITIRELDIPNWKAYAFSHSLVELSTGIKPFVLRHLLKKLGYKGVLYFDPDIAVFSRLDDLLGELEINSIILTPHLTKPEHSIEAIVHNEVASLRHGLYNLGFIGVKKDAQGLAFAEWWCDRCEHFCIGELEQGYFVDQKWVDFVPVFFEGVKILKSSRFNLAPWNVTTRNLEGDFKEGFTVDGEPLGFYHFTGFDSGAHESVVAKYAGNNRALKSLINWYKRETLVNGAEASIPWAFGQFDNGVAISQLHRVIYRAREDLKKAFPDPFKVIEDGHCYYNWYLRYAQIEHAELFKGIVQGSGPTIKVMQNRANINWSRLGLYALRAFREPNHAIRWMKTVLVTFRKQGFRGLKQLLSKG